MYKNQLQELAQRSCFNLPCYTSIREGPDHAPRFKASVNFNGEIFECPSYCNTLRQAEHAAAEVALNSLSTRGPSRSLTARVLDETGVYKNLLQETAHRAGMKLPVYTTVRSGPGHVPVFTSTVEIGGMNFTGESAKTKKQAEKNAAIAAWAALKNMPKLSSLSQSSKETNHHPEELVRRKRDQNQARGRTIKGGGHREHGSNFTMPNQQWRSLDLLLDSSSASSGCSTKKQKSLVPLLPPPPPRPNSQILPPASLFSSSSTTRPAPSQVLAKPLVKLQGAPPPLDEDQMDENEWIIGKTVDSTIVPIADSIYTPPTPRPNSKIIPSASLSSSSSSSTTRPAPSQILAEPPVKFQKEPPPFDQHQMDENEWLIGKTVNSTIVPNADFIYTPIQLLNTGTLSASVLDKSIQNKKTHIRNRLLGAPTTPSPVPLSSIKSLPSSHVGTTTYAGRYGPQRIAPSVQIRSVIPVCTTPPQAMRLTRSDPSSMKGAASASATSISKHTGVEEASSANPKPNNRESYSTHLGSLFNQKLQL